MVEGTIVSSIGKQVAVSAMNTNNRLDIPIPYRAPLMTRVPVSAYSTIHPFPGTFFCVTFLAGNGQPIPPVPSALR